MHRAVPLQRITSPQMPIVPRLREAAQKELLTNPGCTLGSPTAAKSLQSCPTLCDPRDSSLPGSPVPGILQARTLEWDAISFSNIRPLDPCKLYWCGSLLNFYRVYLTLWSSCVLPRTSTHLLTHQLPRRPSCFHTLLYIVA